MFTVEINQQEERVEIYLDKEGMKKLRHSLDMLERQGHDNLMTPSWAGTELTEEAQGSKTSLINHLLIVLKKP
jgi:predicted transcriptional regulator